MKQIPIATLDKCYYRRHKGLWETMPEHWSRLNRTTSITIAFPWPDALERGISVDIFEPSWDW